MAKWLLNYSHVEKVSVTYSEHHETVKELIDKFQYQQGVEKKEQEAQKIEEDFLQNQKDKFYKKVDDSKDLTDELDYLSKYLKDQVNATTVYVGKVEYPRKEI